MLISQLQPAPRVSDISDRWLLQCVQDPAVEEARRIGGAVGVALEQAAHIEGLRSAVAASLRTTATPKAAVGARPRWKALSGWTSAITASRAAARSGSVSEGDSSSVGGRGGLDCSKVRQGAGRAPCSARWQICCRKAVDNCAVSLAPVAPDPKGSPRSMAQANATRLSLCGYHTADDYWGCTAASRSSAMSTAPLCAPSSAVAASPLCRCPSCGDRFRAALHCCAGV